MLAREVSVPTLSYPQLRDEKLQYCEIRTAGSHLGVQRAIAWLPTRRDNCCQSAREAGCVVVKLGHFPQNTTVRRSLMQKISTVHVSPEEVQCLSCGAGFHVITRVTLVTRHHNTILRVFGVSKTTVYKADACKWSCVWKQSAEWRPLLVIGRLLHRR